MKFEERIKQAATEYGEPVSDLSVALAIELFRDVRNYPPGYDELAIQADMDKHTSKIAMASVEIESKNGVENQTAHSENGTNRSYHNGLMAYKGVVGFAHKSTM